MRNYSIISSSELQSSINPPRISSSNQGERTSFFAFFTCFVQKSSNIFSVVLQTLFQSILHWCDETKNHMRCNWVPFLNHFLFLISKTCIFFRETLIFNYPPYRFNLNPVSCLIFVTDDFPIEGKVVSIDEIGLLPRVQLRNVCSFTSEKCFCVIFRFPPIGTRLGL